MHRPPVPAPVPIAPTPPRVRYTRTAIALHWAMALGLAGTFCVGLYMADLPFSPFRLKLFSWHKWAGISLLSLAVLRLAWRLLHPPPPEIAMPAWQTRLAGAVHRALYALFFAAPLVGWAYSSAAGFPVVLFGVLPLPDLVARNKALAHTLESVHAALAWALAACVAVHVAGALKHQFVDRDAVLRRMWPVRRPRAVP